MTGVNADNSKAERGVVPETTLLQSSFPGEELALSETCPIPKREPPAILVVLWNGY